MKLKGKVAIITGASSGIGASVARRFAQEGASACLVGNKNFEQMQDTVKLYSQNGGKAVTVKADLLNIKSLDGIVETALKEFGKIDMLINCAGVMYLRNLEELTEEEWDKIFDINVKAAFFMTQKVAPHLKEKSKIIFIGSIFGPAGVPSAASYSSTKMALHGLTKNLAIELAPRKINVNAVAPGNVVTPLNDPLYEKFGKDGVRALYPIGRLGEVEDISNAIAFLVSDEADWITGTILSVDGGYLAQ